MRSYWLVKPESSIGLATIQAETKEEVFEKAIKACRVITAIYGTIPYPHGEQIGSFDWVCPSLCMGGMKCLGRSSCPRDYACSE